MSKKAIKEVMRKLHKIIIPASYFISDDGSHLFNTYDKELGTCESWWISPLCRAAKSQTLSDILIHEPSDMSQWFF